MDSLPFPHLSSSVIAGTCEPHLQLSLSASESFDRGNKHYNSFSPTLSRLWHSIKVASQNIKVWVMTPRLALNPSTTYGSCFPEVVCLPVLPGGALFASERHTDLMEPLIVHVLPPFHHHQIRPTCVKYHPMVSQLHIHPYS